MTSRTTTPARRKSAKRGARSASADATTKPEAPTTKTTAAKTAARAPRTTAAKAAAKTTTRTATKTVAKTGTRTKAATKTAPAPIRPARKTPAAAKVAPKVVTVAEPAVSQPDLRKRELIDRVVARSGMKKKDAKPIVEAALEVLGDALADGRELNLQPFGKLKIQRKEEKANGTMMVCRLRQSSAAKSPPLKAAE